MPTVTEKRRRCVRFTRLPSMVTTTECSLAVLDTCTLSRMPSRVRTQPLDARAARTVGLCGFGLGFGSGCGCGRGSSVGPGLRVGRLYERLVVAEARRVVVRDDDPVVVEHAGGEARHALRPRVVR